MKMTDAQRVALYNHNMSILDKKLREGYEPSSPTTSLILSKGKQIITYMINHENKYLERCV